MLEAITWKEYLAGLAIIIITYYALIGLLFHRQGINITLIRTTDPELQKRKDSAAPHEEQDEEREFDEEEDWHGGEDEKTDNLFDELEEIVTDIRHRILDVAGNQADKEMLLSQIKSRVAGYGGLSLDTYRTALNNFIIQHADSICGVVFTEDELEEAWATLPR